MKATPCSYKCDLAYFSTLVSQIADTVRLFLSGEFILEHFFFLSVGHKNEAHSCRSRVNSGENDLTNNFICFKIVKLED